MTFPSLDSSGARPFVIAASIWGGVLSVAICLLAGLQTISPSLYAGGDGRRRSTWQRFGAS